MKTKMGCRGWPLIIPYMRKTFLINDRNQEQKNQHVTQQMKSNDSPTVGHLAGAPAQPRRASGMPSGWRNPLGHTCSPLKQGPVGQARRQDAQGPSTLTISQGLPFFLYLSLRMCNRGLSKDEPFPVSNDRHCSLCVKWANSQQVWKELKMRELLTSLEGTHSSPFLATSALEKTILSWKGESLRNCFLKSTIQEDIKSMQPEQPATRGITRNLRLLETLHPDRTQMPN